MYKFYPILFSVVFFALALMSCKEDHEVPNPNLHFQIKTKGNVKVMHRTETLTADFENEEYVKKVAFSLDGKKIAEDNEAPFEMEWNTLEVEDGDHTIIATAINAAGTPFESALEVSVSNILFTFQADPGALVKETRILEVWAYLNGSDGNIIGQPVEVKEGEITHVLRPEGYTEEKYNFNIFRLSESYPTGERSYWVRSYSGFQPGKSIAFKHYAPQPANPLLDEFNVTIARETKNDESIFIINNFGAYWGNQRVTELVSSINYKVYVKKETDKYYITYQPYTGFDYAFYKRLDHSPGTTEYQFDANKFTPMDKKVIPLDKTPGYKSARIFGIDGTDQYRVYFASSKSDISQEIPYYTIDAEFDDYIYTFHYTMENGSYSVYGKGNPSDAKFMNNSIDANFASSDQLTLTGTEGADVILFEKDVTASDYNFTYQYFSHNNEKQIILPEIPGTLIEQYPEISQVRQEKVSAVTLYDYNNLDSYKEWTRLQFNPNIDEGDDYWVHYGGYTAITKTFGSRTTGRYKTSASRERLLEFGTKDPFGMATITWTEK